MMGKKLYNFINNGGWIPVLMLGGFGVILCLIGFIMQFFLYGFNLGIFIFDVAIVAFCAWAIFVGVVKPIVKHPEIFKVKEVEHFSDMFEE